MTDTAASLIRNSPYTIYSGVAAEDLADGTILKVICPELIPNAAFGTVGPGIVNGRINLQDRDGNNVSSTVNTANHLVATWEGQSNQRYAPKIRKGEQVEVYKIGNQDKFYWRTTGRGRDFRTTDRVHFEIAATSPDKPGVEKNDTNTYSAWMDSENQTLGFKTSKVNGEAAALSMEADLKVGTFLLSDDGEDPGNRIFLDTGAKSGNPIFQVNLSSGITFKFENDNLFIKVPGKAMIDVGDRLIFNSPITIFNTAKTGTIIFNATAVVLNTAKDIILAAAGAIGLNAAGVKVSGVLVAAGVRAANAVKGAVGSLYGAPSVQRPEESPVTNVNNSVDSELSGPPYRT